MARTSLWSTHKPRRCPLLWTGILECQRAPLGAPRVLVADAHWSRPIPATHVVDLVGAFGGSKLLFELTDTLFLGVLLRLLFPKLRHHFLAQLRLHLRHHIFFRHHFFPQLLFHFSHHLGLHLCLHLFLHGLHRELHH